MSDKPAFPFYPPDWPRCPVCDDPALDGHITCGKFQCDESGQRAKRAALITYCDYLLKNPLREKLTDADEYLDGDYKTVGSRRAYQWGE